MHVVFREAQGLEETEIPMDLRQTPADLVVLSFSDSDLGAFSCLLYTSPSPRDGLLSRMPSSA